MPQNELHIGLLSDTHGHWDDRLAHHLKSCDEIWHAGDIGDFNVIEAIEELKPLKFRVVYGNIDHARLRSEFPEFLEWTIQGVKFIMTHIGGRPSRYSKGIRALLMGKRPDVFICGHSHMLLIQRDESWGGLFMNPGAAGMQGFHQVRTLLKFTITNGMITDLKAIELGDRRKMLGLSKN